MRLFGNGHDPDLERREKAAEKDFERSMHNGNLESASVSNDVDEFEQLIESGVAKETVWTLQDLMSKDRPLANFTPAETHEQKWLDENLMLRVERMHPHKDSALRGEWRAFIFDDPSQALDPLDDMTRARVRAFINNGKARLSRGRKGWQQEQRSKQTRVSIAKKEHEGGDGGWFSR